MCVFESFTEMAESLPVVNKTPTSSNGCIPHDGRRFPLQVLSKLDLFHQSEDGDNSNDATDALGYDSDGNEPPVTTLEDIFHTEPEAGLETSTDDSPQKDDC